MRATIMYFRNCHTYKRSVVCRAYIVTGLSKPAKHFNAHKHEKDSYLCFQGKNQENFAELPVHVHDERA